MPEPVEPVEPKGSAAPDGIAAPTPVRATLVGPWPGADALGAAAAVVGQLGAPHLPVVPELPARGPGSDPVGRTAVMLEELAVDLLPHGWRLTDTPGMDARRGAAAWRTDLNRMADAAGAAGTDLGHLTVRVTGPLTLAARLWLPGGERALSDAGARRDITDSLVAGLAEQLRTLRSVTGADRVTVVLDEPDVGRVLTGAMPTASGYRTVRSVPRAEARGAWSTLASAMTDAGAGVVLAPGEGAVGWTDLALLATEALPPVGSTGGNGPMTGLVLPFAPLDGPGADPQRWEIAAGWAETGRTVMLGLPWAQSLPPGHDPRDRFLETSRSIASTWERLGMSENQLGSLVLRGPDLSAATAERARQVTAAVVHAAEELERIRVDGGLSL